MRQVQAGDTRKLGLLYERHKEGLFAYFFRCCNDRYLSEDLVQNVFIKVIKYKNQFKGTGAFNFWLYRIARNTWLDSVTKNDPMRKALEIDNDRLEGSFSIRASHMISEQDQKSKLKQALDRISPDKKDAIILSRYHGLDYKTIAEMSDCSESAIKSRVMRGLSEIKELVKQY